MKALVLCAGFGSRLGDVCSDIPKPLLTVGDRAIVAHIIESLSAQGWTDIWVNLHHHAHQFPPILGDGEAFGVRIHYVQESAPQGTAGTVANLRDQFAGESVLVHYGDILTTHNLRELVEFHSHTNAGATMLVHQRKGSNSCAVFGDDGRIDRFYERPKQLPSTIDQDESWAFSGVCVLSQQVMARLTPGRVADLPADLFSQLACERCLYAQRLCGFRCAIDSPQRLQAARKAWQEAEFVPVTRTFV